MEKQRISNTGIGDSDVIAFSRAMDEALVQVFFIRGGKLIGRDHFHVRVGTEQSEDNILNNFVKQFYSGTPFIP